MSLYPLWDHAFDITTHPPNKQTTQCIVLFCFYFYESVKGGSLSVAQRGMRDAPLCYPFYLFTLLTKDGRWSLGVGREIGTEQGIIAFAVQAPNAEMQPWHIIQRNHAQDLGGSAGPMREIPAA